MFRRLVLFLLFVIMTCDVANAIVCRAYEVDGYEAAHLRGSKYLPTNTTDISKIAVYIERDPNGSFYFQSNFLSADAKYPTKIAGEKINDLDQALMNIVYLSLPSEVDRKSLHGEMVKNMTLVVNKDIFDQDDTTKLDFRGRTKVLIVDPDAKTSTEGLVINANRPPPFGAERVLGCCVNGRPLGDRARSLVGLLRRSEMDRSRTKIVTLVSDSATLEAIDSSPLNDMRMHARDVLPSEADLEEAFRLNRGKDVIVVGHVEGDDFVTKDARGAVRGTLPISRLRSMAAKYDILLVELGCNTAGSASLSHPSGAAVATRFNTVDAVRRLVTALDAPLTLSTFFEGLASDNIQVVIDHGAIEKRYQYHAAYYDLSGETAIKVADVTLTTRSTDLFSTVARWFRR